MYHFEAEEYLEDIKDKLQHLTMGIHDMTTDEVPRSYQRHITGVSRWFSRLLRRVAQDIT